MPNEQNIIINLTIDAQKSQEVLRTFKEFNDSFKGLSISLDELDKKGLNTFDKLLNILGSSRTGDATKKIQDLSNELKGLFVSIGGVANIGAAAGGTQGSPQAFSASGNFIPSSSFLPNQQIISNILSGGSTQIPYQPMQNAQQVQGSQSGGAAVAAALRMLGLGPVGTVMAGGIAGAIAVPAALTAAARTADYFQTIGSISTAVVQDVERRPFREAQQGDITLSVLRDLKLGVGYEREQVKREIDEQEARLRRFEETPGEKFDYDPYSSRMALNLKYARAAFSTGHPLVGLKNLAGYTDDSATRAAFAEWVSQGLDISKKEYGEAFGYIGATSQKMYQMFDRTYQFSSPEAVKAMFGRYAAAGFSAEDLQRQQSIAAAIGVRTEDIPMNQTALGRRFGFSQGAELAVNIFGGNTLGKYFGALNYLMGEKAGGAATELYSDMLQRRQMQFLAEGDVDYGQTVAPIVAAKGYMGDISGLKPIQQTAMIEKTSKYLEAQAEGEGSPGEMALYRALFSKYGITNYLQQKIIVNLLKTGQREKALDIIKKITGRRPTSQELGETITAELKPFEKAAKGAIGIEGDVGFDVMAMLEGTYITTKKGASHSAAISEAVVGGELPAGEGAPRFETPDQKLRVKQFQQFTEVVSKFNKNILDILIRGYDGMTTDLKSQVEKTQPKQPTSFDGNNASTTTTSTTMPANNSNNASTTTTSTTM